MTKNSLPKRNKIAFQGEHGAYSEIAAQKYFGIHAAMIPCPSFDEVFKAVAKGKALQGIVPLENSVAGTIHRIYDLLARHSLVLDGEIFLRISHNLLANSAHAGGAKRIRQIRRVYSHPQALDQCEEFLKRHPWIEVISFRDTAGAAREVALRRRQDEAAIASRVAASLYGLSVVADHIETDRENYTRFGAIIKPAKKPISAITAHPKSSRFRMHNFSADATKQLERLNPRKIGIPSHRVEAGEYLLSAVKGNKVSLLLTLPHVAGSLSRFLVQCAGRGMNLTKVESRPLLGKPWEYLFYVDFEHTFSPEALTRALSALRHEAVTLTVLGTYERGAAYEL
ncbi:MAG: prephenate dehydratase domain-containing protein [Patescibacteria group bacterium]